MGWVTRLARRGIVAAGLAVAASPLALASSAEAAGVTVEIHGSVTCPEGKPPVGVWMHSSGGGSRFLTRTRMASTVHEIQQKITTTLPTTVSFDVGCGGSEQTWAQPTNRSGKLTIAAGRTKLYVNLSCDGAGTCVPFKNDTTPTPSTTVNPVGAAYSSQCTYRAAELFKKMTGGYPNWKRADGRIGNAAEWDDLAKATGWSVGGVPRPDSLVVWDPGVAGAHPQYGHVGYVKDVRISNGYVEVYVVERNWAVKGGDGERWTRHVSGMRYILAAPRAP